MLVLIGGIVALLCFYVSSWPFRLIYVGAPVAFIAMMADIKMFRSGLAAPAQAYFTSFEGMKVFLTLPMAYASVIVLGTILGIMRKSSSSPVEYTAKKARFFKFLILFGLKWGVPYLLFLEGARAIINHMYDDSHIGWFFTKAFGLYFFGAYVVLALIVSSWWRKTVAKRHAPAGQPTEATIA